MERLRTGVIGAGFIGPMHIEAVRRLGYAEVSAIATSRQKTADRAAEMLKIPRAYGSWEDLVNDPDIDVVHICCSNFLHYPISKACLELGKPVICDKPLTLDLAEAKELVDIAKRNNVVNATTFNLGFYPMIREAKEIIARDELGRINLVFGRYMQDWLVKDTDYNWRVESKYQGKSRAIADIGSHWLQMVQMLLNKKIVSVYGDTSIFIPKRKKPLGHLATFEEKELKEGEYEEIIVDTEDHATVMLKFEDGIKGVLMVAQVCPGRKQRLEWEISGSNKSIAWQNEEPENLWVGYRTKPNENYMKDPGLMSEYSRTFANSAAGLSEGYLDSWKNIMSRIYSYIIDNGNKKEVNPDFPTFEEGYRIMVVIEAILKSVAEDKWIDINW